MDSTKDRIIQGATELFLRSGIKAATMDDVAQSLGMSKRTIYENFSDKLQLLRECLKHHNCAKQKEWNESMQLSLVEHLNRMQKKITTDMREHARVLRFLQEIKKYYPTLYYETVELVLGSNLKIARTCIEKGQNEGFFLTEIDTDVAANVLVAQMDLFILSDRFIEAPNIVALMHHVLIIFFRGISTPKGITEIDAMLRQVLKEKQ
jgi:AcrR family transcriptional regulator